MRPTCLPLTLAVWTIILAFCLPASGKPPLTVLEHPTPKELERGFHQWAEDYPGHFSYEKRGITPEGRPILMGRITDSSVPDDDKQIALLTSCHAQVSEVRLDGHRLEESARDGYHVRHNPGTIVEVAVPPGKTEDLHIVSCLYDTPTQRRAGFTPQDW